MIVVKDLKKSHGSTLILNGISVHVVRGDVAAVIGPSGGGKSTFLRCINGLELFQGGEVTVGDLRVTPGVHPRRDAELLERVRRRVGFVFQQFNLFPHLTVLGNLTEAPVRVLKISLDEAAARAAKLLERVGLADKIDAWPRNLSGGQQQRVAIARTLMMQPEALLFDEPTSALDPVTAGDVLELMADLARDGQTMIVVTHSMRFARNVASHVHVFAEGQNVEQGPPRQIFEDPRHPTTQSFLRHSG